MTKRWVGGVLALLLLVGCDGQLDDPVSAKVALFTRYPPGPNPETDLMSVLPSELAAAEARLHEYGYAPEPAIVQRAMREAGEEQDYYFPDFVELPPGQGRQYLFRQIDGCNNFQVLGVALESDTDGNLVKASGFTLTYGSVQRAC